MTATDVTGFDAIFSIGFFVFSPVFMGEPPVETAPRNCRFLSFVVGELVLSLCVSSFQNKWAGQEPALDAHHPWIWRKNR